MLWTSDVRGASTHGDVYLGFGGREFSVDREEEDFEQGDVISYTFGEGTNVRFPDFNDPRDPQLLTEDAVRQPVYIRFAPQDRTDNWNVDNVSVTVNGNLSPIWWTRRLANVPKRGIWLGVHAGLIVHLPLQAPSSEQAMQIERVIIEQVARVS